MNGLATRVVRAALMALILVIGVLTIRHETLTYDEPLHCAYGTNILKLDSDRFIDGTMPFSALNALPQRLGHALPPGWLRDALAKAETGRLVTILFSVLLAYYVFKWTKELYGALAGSFSLLIYAVSPNIIAHSGLITTDVYAAGMAAISTYYFWRFVTSGGWRRATVSALVLGLSQLAKYSCPLLYPIFGVIVVVKYWGELSRAVKAKAWMRFAGYFGKFLRVAVFFGVVSLVVINAGFLFNKSFLPLGDYDFQGNSFRSLQTRLHLLRNLPVPLPYPYLQGLDWGSHNVESGQSVGNIYLLGHLRQTAGFKGYYFFAYLFKEPLAIQVLLVLAIVFYVLRRRAYRFVRDEVFLVVPIIFYAVYFNFFFKLQIGIRHYLVVFPLLYIFCGSLLAPADRGEAADAAPATPRPQKLGLKTKVAIVALLAYLIISVASYFPYYIPYFNELVWDRKQAYRILADSNVEWGQNGWYVEEYLKHHADVLVDPGRPVAGKIAVDVNSLVGVYAPERYRWLRENFKPVGQIAYSFLIFDISPQALEHLR